MSRSTAPELDNPMWLRGEYITYWGIIWSVLALILHLNFGTIDPSSKPQTWFVLTTLGFEQIGLLVAGMLCWRNWRSDYIPSGRGVWLLFAIAMLAFFVGNLCFGWWELVWGLDPAASVGNLFFGLFYLMLIGGVRLAMLDRDVQLAKPQWVAVAGIAIVGLTIGCWLTTFSAKAELPIAVTPQVRIDTGSTLQTGESLITSKPPLHAPSLPTNNSIEHPGWVVEIDRWMQPLVSTFNLFYVLCDTILLIFAAILFLGFWGGQLGLPWRTTAQAVLCFYIADTWFAYASDRVQGYQSGSIMEVFWVFGIVQFGIAAALEFDNSIRARRLARRRTAIKQI
jgi:hypothetical protein